MDELELTRWLDALVEARLIAGWRWEFGFGESPVFYVIDGRVYSHDGAVRLVRDFEASYVA